jgi:hypothetical protein
MPMTPVTVSAMVQVDDLGGGARSFMALSDRSVESAPRTKTSALLSALVVTD